MDAPRIQYAKTEDGVSIAYWRIGAGIPVIFMLPAFGSHIGIEWQIPAARTFYERLASKCEVIRFDPRGSGLSDREVERIGIDGYVDDLTAVIARLGRGPFILAGSADMFKAALKFTVANQDLVLGLVGLDPVVGISRVNPVTISLRSMKDTDWPSWCEMVSLTAAPTGHPIVSQIARLLEQASSPQLSTAWTAVYETDVNDLVARVSQPVLIVHLDFAKREGQRAPFFIEVQERTRRVAGSFSDSRLVTVTGEHGWTWAEGTADAITSFLDEIAPAAPGAPQTIGDSGAFRTILFTDLADHTAMMQRLGDAKGREVLREHERTTREMLAAHAGTEIKAMGDGFMASFGSAQKALECAIALQRAFEGTLSPGPSPTRGEGSEEGSSSPSPSTERGLGGEVIRLHIGVNAGEPIAEDDDLFGSSVILAARAASKATAGQILVTNVVRELVAGKGFSFADAGDFEMKGFEEPVRLYEVRWA